MRKMLGGFSKYDGTIEFYERIRSVLSNQSVVLDVGAGRGAWFEEGAPTHTRTVRHLRPDVARMIACDVDAAVLGNRTAHECLLIQNGRVPLPDASVDVLIADYVLEHVEDVELFRSEVGRLLRPGGYFCARTPHALNYVSIAARLIRNKRHATLLRWVQPSRKEVDVFPTRYRLNTFSRIRRVWDEGDWENYSYAYTAEPQYYFGSRLIFALMSVLHGVLPAVVTGNLFVFLRKK